MQNQRAAQSIWRSGIAYGVGFALGMLLIYVLLNNPAGRGLSGLLDSQQPFLRLAFRLVLIFIVFGLGGGVAGFIGGYWGGNALASTTRRGFAWRSGWSFFITQIVVIIPLVLLAAVVGFLNPDLDTHLQKLPLLFALFGLIYGALAGLLLGIFTAGLRQTLGIFLAALFGFALGGWLFGFGLRFYSLLDSPGRLLTILILTASLFLFGAVGGGALGFAYRHIDEKRPLFPPTRGWRIVRNLALVLIAVIFLGAIGKFIETFTVRPVDLAQTLTLPTVGTHWMDAETAVSSAPPTTADPSISAACDESGAIQVAAAGVPPPPASFPPCLNQPLAAEGGDGRLHLLWYSDQVVKMTGAQANGHFLYESIYGQDNDQGWSEPAIIARPDALTQPALAAEAGGSLRLAWSDDGGEHQLTNTPYDCEGVPLTPIGEALYAAVRQGPFWQPDNPIPYCQNRFDQLLYTPNPTAPESEKPVSDQGAFDRVAELVTAAEYEVLFVTMQWDLPSPAGSPGSTLAQAVAALYERVRANPAAYPRGMTVRILLGNIPELAFFDPTSQVYHTLQDLHDAGLTQVVNEEIGWRLEVANFGGQWPHAHTKFIVVDGKTAAAAGFNYSYLHLPAGHPSGQGLDMTDLGLQVTGPVAQAVLAAYDDLWSVSELTVCSRFPPPLPRLDFLWCDSLPTETTHPPEVLRFYPTADNANAFALHHTTAHLEADEALTAAMLAAEETIDIFEVNFSLDTVCLGAIVLIDLCEGEAAVPTYMHTLLAAIVENDVHVRAIVEESAFNGLENRIGIRWLLNEAAEHGKQENVEIKFADHKMHGKALLIDNELLVIGSQNFHYSAWDSPSLTEYNLATEDSQAIADFLQEYEHHWSIGKPAEEAMFLEP
jgi:phosphatidylserine/phosphatidylglycerophosphate/cardiolipin synthase-like enzyme